MLAINGGTPVRNTSVDPWPSWPMWSDDEKASLVEVLESGIWSYNGPKETEFLRMWQDQFRVPHALLVANGTVSLQLALEALDVGVGDEVIVPGLTWQATAAAVVDVNATPILVDVEPDTWCIDPDAFESSISARTRAVIPVHLYGNIADMDRIVDIAKARGISVIEDAAHKHGAEWNGKSVGTLGDIGSFSMQLSKIMTAGEGGVLTTNDYALWYRLDALRNCGRRPENVETDKGSGEYGEEGDLIQSGNYRATEFQAAVLIAQLGRMESQNRVRQANAEFLDELLAEIPGCCPMKKDPRETRRSYFNYAFRVHEEETGVPVARFRAALAREIGIGVNACYQPLNDCNLYRPQTKKRHQLNDEYWRGLDPTRFDLPECTRAYRETSVTIAHRALLGTQGDMEQIANAVRKVIDHKGEVRSFTS